MKSCFLIIAITVHIAVYCQSTKYTRVIEWKSNQPFYEPEADTKKPSEKYLFFFENAIYRHNLNHLPIYTELLPVSQNEYTVTIENTVFEAVETTELNHVESISHIVDAILVESKVVYIRKKAYLNISFIPLRKNASTGKIEKLTHFDLKITETGRSILKKQSNKRYASNSVLSTGKWVKIKINRSGVYKITFEQLTGLGIENPQNTRIFGNGGKMLPINNNEENSDDLIENKILIKNNAVYFYGEGPVEWKYDSGSDFFQHQKHLYSNYAYYFISSDYNSGFQNQIQNENQSENPATHQINTYIDYTFHEIDTTNLISSGKLWVGEKFDFTTEYNFDFTFSNLLANSPIKLETSLLARSPINSSFTISINNQTYYSNFTLVSYSNTSSYANQKIEKFSGNTGSSNSVSIRFQYNKSTASSEAWLDYFTLNVKRQLVLANEQLQFRNIESVGSGNIGQFTIEQANDQTEIWDITNKQQARKINSTLNGTTLQFKVATDTLREFVAFNETMVLAPILSGNDLGLVENQNLHGISNADMIIVCPSEFYDQAQSLKEIHEQNDQISVFVVKNQQVYNEFSSGAPDISALRNFIRMLYKNADNENEMPRYLCLFGDGSYDNIHVNSQNSNYILTYQSENSLNPTQSFVTDDFYGFLDEDEGGSHGFLDIGIGRLPVRSTTEATNAITKIRNYLDLTSYGNWRNNICFIADDEDDNSHVIQADELSTIVKNNYPVFNIEKVYLDAFVQQSSSSGQRYPDVNRTIDNLISKGMLIVNYTGHGNEKWLAEENILNVDQINKYDNTYKMPVFMTATCEFSRFDDYLITSAGEYLFQNPRGAAIALFTTTRLVYSSPNFTLNKCFYKYIFENDPISGKRYTLGDAMRLTKNSSNSEINDRNFTLLGDPALKLSFADLMVKTNSINQQTVTGFADTLKALEKITVVGEIQDKTGTKLSEYNGTVYPTVFDKKQAIKTLNNDGDGSFNYFVINSQIYKGKASVKSGEFQYSFIIPKDIRYNIDTGKISYYSTNLRLLEDAKGCFTNFMIGGISDQTNSDKIGPSMRIYLNDDNFVSGGITNSNPKLIVYLSDSSGINTTGSGIGHDIVASIDNNADLKFIVNDYYESDVDDYTKGKIKYNLPELSSGEHILKMKAWDTNNNSSEDSINFTVTPSESFEISHVLNYPNPFSNNTSFFFEHNRPNELLEVIIHVYTVSGKIIKTIRSDITSPGFRSTGIVWDGRDDFGNKPGRGVYFYKLSVRTSNGEKTSKIEKLLILN